MPVALMALRGVPKKSGKMVRISKRIKAGVAGSETGVVDECTTVGDAEFRAGERRRSRFPSGMTERTAKARARAGAKVETEGGVRVVRGG